MLFSSFHSSGQGLAGKTKAVKWGAYVGAFMFLWQQWLMNGCCDMCMLSEHALSEL